MDDTATTSRAGGIRPAPDGGVGNAARFLAGAPKIMKTTEKVIQIGFVPMTDCAPVVMAHELGLFAQYGLRVELQRQPGWGRLRDALTLGSIDAAHAPAPLPFAVQLGLGAEQCNCVSGLVLSLQGNAIILSRDLWETEVRDAATFQREILRRKGSRTFTLGVGFPYASELFLLRQWLKSGGINPDRDVRTVIIPPPQLYPNLKLGYLDGYCTGEPWSTLAVEAGAGFSIAISPALAPHHPEKVLMARASFADRYPEEHVRLLAALLEACQFCDQNANRRHVAECLAQPQYVNAPADCLQVGLIGPLPLPGKVMSSFLDLNIFFRNQANEPTDEKAAWIMRNLSELLQSAVLRSFYQRLPELKNVFRPDLFERAKAACHTEAQEIAAAAHP